MTYRLRGSVPALAFALATGAGVFFAAASPVVSEDTVNSRFRVSTVARTGMPVDIVKRRSHWNFGPGSLWTHRGWQYAAYWDDARQVSVARRQLPTGLWEVVSLPDYRRGETGERGKGGRISRGFGDGHEKVALGISADGTMHLSFDHHLSTLRYRVSRDPVAQDPAAHTWGAHLFGPVQDHLGGHRLDRVTYPRFYRDGLHLALYMRLGGGSGAANSHCFTRKAGRWTVTTEKASQFIDQHWSGGDGTVNAYPHGLAFRQGRWHLTWCWRDTPNERTCHDLCYAYSDDQGQTWQNNEGQTIGVTGSTFITADSPGVAVWKIPPGTRYRNGGSMTVDPTGRVHVLMRGERARPAYFTRDPDTGTWSRRPGRVLGSLVEGQADELFVITEEGLYQTSASDFGHEMQLSVAGRPEFFEDCSLSVDRTRLAFDGWISVIGQQGKTVRVVDYRLGEDSLRSDGILIDKVWSGHPVGFALLTEQGHQFVAYYDAERRLTVTGRRLGQADWERVQPEGVPVPGRGRRSNVTGWDSHNRLVLALDRDGCLHLSGNMHADPLVYYRTREPFDLTTLERVDAMTGEREDRVTYPTFFANHAGELLFRYRDGGSGNGSDLYNVYDPVSREWRRLFDGPLLDGEGERSAYSTGPRRGPDGRFHMVWMWRDTPDAMTNHTLSYARSRDLVHWETSTGRPIARPIQWANGEVIDPAKPGEGLINMTFRLGFDREQRPVVAYHRFDEEGRSQAFVARPDGEGTWTVRQISDWTFRWDFSGPGSQVGEVRLSGPTPDQEGNLLISFSSQQAGAGRWRIQGDTLSVIEQLPPAVTTLAQPLPKPGMTYPGLKVRHTSVRSGGSRWTLRWQTLGPNRDLKHRDVPLPSELWLFESPYSSSGE